MTRDPHQPMNPWPELSPARRGLDLLLAAHPYLDLVSARIPGRDPYEPSPLDVVEPWLLVELGQPSTTGDAYAIWRFAIWRSTGAVHRVDADGAVVDPPIEFATRPA